MADTNTTVHIGENSPEQVAFKLLQLVSEAEARPLHHSEKHQRADRQYILSTYWQCLMTVKGMNPGAK